LIIAGTETGAANALSANDTDGVLAALGVVDAVGDFSRVLQEASDAVIVLDGLEVTRSSNTIDDLIEGVTFEVVAEGSAKVDVSLDAEPAVTAVKEMIDAYNETLDWINIRLTEETKEDPQSDVEKKWGLLKGDPLLWNCKQKMRNITSRARYDQEGGYNTLASIGIATESTDFGKSGKLEFDESAFMKAMLENPGRVKDIMQSFATEMADFSKGMISGTPEIIGGVTVKQGTLVNRIDTLEQQSSRIDKRIADFEARLEMEKASLEKLYTNMEIRLSEMNYQSYYTSALWEYGSGNSNR
ncbi:MAG: Flagellar hook-associated 2 domain-containing protein, partial [Synergistales bacterium 53_16]